MNTQKLNNLSSVEYTSLGDGIILHSLVSGAILLSNFVGLALYRLLLSGEDLQNIAAHLFTKFNIPIKEALPLCEEIIKAWEVAGLLNEAKDPVLHPVTYKPLIVPHEEFTLSSPNISLSIKCTDPILTQQLKEILQRHQCDQVTTTTTIEITNINHGFGVFVNTHPIWEQCDRDLARHLVLREVAMLLCGKTQTSAILHAGCVAHDTHGSLVIAGNSGYGKSTLTAGLVATGLQYLTDDLLPLHINGESVMAFPTLLGLKQGAWNLAEAQSLGFSTTASHTMPRDGVIYRNVANASALGTRSKVSAVIFPQFGRANENSLTPLSPETALHKLIEAGARTNRDFPSIIPMAKLLNQVPAYELHYSSSTYSVQTCLDLLR